MDKVFIVEQVEKYKPTRVTLTGGEPLLHPQVMEILRYLTQRKISVNIVTNGTLLNRFGERLGNLAAQSEATGTDFSLGLSYDGNSKKEIGKIGDLIDLGIKRIKLYVYPFWKDERELRDLLETAAIKRISVQLLYPVPIGSHQEYTDYSSWKERVDLFVAESNKLDLEAFYQPNWANLCDMDSIMGDLNDNVSIDSDGLTYECCLLTGLEDSQRLNLYEKCQWRNNEGCLAIRKNMGRDRRLEENTAPAICPILISRT